MGKQGGDCMRVTNDSMSRRRGEGKEGIGGLDEVWELSGFNCSLHSQRNAYIAQ